MADSELQYDVFVEDALRSVVQRSIAYVVENGLPGEHHLYITFRTGHPSVVMSDELRQRYASEMTIVLQHQFWDLRCDDVGFGVTLSFGSVPQDLWVPYEAVIAFADPSVRFGLQFDVVGEEDSENEDEDIVEDAPEEAPTLNDGANIITLDTFRKKD